MAGFKLFGPVQQALTFAMRVRSARHELLSANIANADTPGYRPRDIDFQMAMQELIDAREPSTSQPDGFPRRDSGRLPDPAVIPFETVPLGNEIGGERLDGNSVSLDRQMAALTENALAYETSLTLLSRTMAALRYVIGDGRR